MRILICSPFGADAARGNSVAAKRLARGFEARGREVTILDPDSFRNLWESNGNQGFQRQDILLALHARHCSTVITNLKSKFKIPVVVSLRGTDINEMISNPEQGPIVLRVLDISDGIVVFHGKAADDLRGISEAYAPKVKIIPNGLELPQSKVDYRKKLGIPGDAVVFVSLAGLREVKRPLWPLKPLAELRNKYPNVLFLHAGPSLEEKTAKDFFEAVKGLEWVVEAGVAPHEEIDSFLRAGDVFVSAGRSEGMPHAVREAMAAGLPAILSDIEGHRRILTPGEDGFIFHDEQSFLQAAENLVKDNGLRRKIGARARENILRTSGENDEIGEYLKFFDELV